jgi:hypothetical protein
MEGTRFFLIMAFVMSALIVAGFVSNIVTGRSSFSEPWSSHLHGGIFMGWIGLYLVQHVSIAAGNRKLHAALGRIAYAYVPVMVLAGAIVMISAARRTGGPIVFAQNEFIISNFSLLLGFAGLALWSLRQRRQTGWHRRLMLCAMAVMMGPGLGRLLPMPLFVPYAWLVANAVTWLFPVIGMIADLRGSGRIHPAYIWGLGILVGTFAISMVLAYSPVGYAFSEWLVAGSPGAQRPVEARVPPGFGS